MTSKTRKEGLVIGAIRRRRTFALLALLAIATLQLATVQHEAEHLLGDLTESCETCLKLDSPVAAETAFAHAGAFPADDAALSVHGDLFLDRQPTGNTRSRAPPRA
jgi:hypothetical protein